MCAHEPGARACGSDPDPDPGCRPRLRCHRLIDCDGYGAWRADRLESNKKKGTAPPEDGFGWYL